MAMEAEVGMVANLIKWYKNELFVIREYLSLSVMKKNLLKQIYLNNISKNNIVKIT